MTTAYVVLVTDFVNIHTAYGPFDSAQEAHNWAFQHLPEVYRVFPLNPPTEANAEKVREKATE
jgi:hypothetical protein